MRGAPGGITETMAWTLPERYADVTHLASGGMADVYRATDTLLGREVAVKVLAERHARDPDVRGRFTREAYAAARLSAHPHVVTVFDVGEVDERPFIVMEFLEGGSIYERLRAGPVTTATALTWLGQAASALDAAHAQGVVHRDVKPANLLLDDEGRIHVSDFGIASAAGLDTLTLPGTVLGTAGYLAPEQARGEAATPATDVYALGVVAFELLTGHRPYEAESQMAEALGHVQGEIPSARRLAPALPRGVDAALRRALAKDPGKRPESATELVEELRRAFREAEQETAILRSPTPPLLAAGGRRRLWLIPAALLALLVAGISTAAVMAGDDPPEVLTVTRDRTQVSTVSGTTTTVTVPSDPEELPPAEDADAAALNDEAWALIQDGEYDAALPLLEQAVSELAGSDSLTEAFASYNLALTRFTLGSCDGVPELLDRSEQIQGSRKEIDRLRRDAERRCSDHGPGRGSGKGEDD